MPFCLTTARICFADRRPALFRKRALAALALVAACGGDGPSSPSHTDPKPGRYAVTLTTATDIQSTGTLMIGAPSGGIYPVSIASIDITVQPGMMGPPWLVFAKVGQYAIDIQLALSWSGSAVSCTALYRPTLNPYGSCTVNYLGS